MQYSLVQHKEDMYATFWVLPLILSLLSILLVVATLYIDYSGVLAQFNTYFNNFIGLETAKTVLSIIATSVITITSVTFSITVLTLSIASEQLGPRLLPNFMRQKPTQFVLGFFIGTFVYTLLLLESMSIYNPYSPVPYVSVVVGLVLGISCFFLLIYFIHYVCHVIQIDNVLSLLTRELEHSINRLLPDLGHVQHQEILTHESPLVQEKNKRSLCSTKSGYIQTIDDEALYKLSVKHKVVMNVHLNAGMFLFPGMEMVTVYSEKPLKKRLRNKVDAAVQLGKHRSTVQDIEFAFEQLSEIALHALSPGINHPYTAIHCVNCMFQGFSLLSKKALLPHTLTDKKGVLRIMRKITDYNDIVTTALDRLRQAAVRDLSVSMHLFIMLGRFLKMDVPLALSQALQTQATLLYESLLEQDFHQQDLQKIKGLYMSIKS